MVSCPVRVCPLFLSLDFKIVFFPIRVRPMELQKRKERQVGILTATEQQHQEDLQRLRDLRPIDDDFMRFSIMKIV